MQRVRSKSKVAQRRSGDAEAAARRYVETESANGIAIAIDIMRLASEARRQDLAKLLRSGSYRRISA